MVSSTTPSSYVALPLTVDELSTTANPSFYNEDDAQEQTRRLVRIKRVAIGTMTLLIIGAMMVVCLMPQNTGNSLSLPSLRGASQQQPPSHDSSIVVASTPTTTTTSVTKSKDAALEERMDALGYMDKSRPSKKSKKQTARSSSIITKGNLDPYFSKEDLSESGVFQVIEEETPVSTKRTEETQRQRRQQEEVLDEEEESEDAESDSEEEDFLSTYTWTEKDFMVIDFSTDEYETKDLNRVQDGDQ